MDDNRFDLLTREVGLQTGRRTLVKTALGGALTLVGFGAAGRRAGAKSEREGSNCFTNADCGTGLICEGVRPSLIGGLVSEGYGPPTAGALFGPNPGTCRYRSDNCGRSGQFCRSDGDCCNGLNLTCRNDKCQRDN